MDLFKVKRSNNSSDFIDLLSANKSYIVQKQDHKAKINQLKDIRYFIDKELVALQQTIEQENEMCYDLFSEILEQAFQEHRNKNSNSRTVNQLTVMKPAYLNTCVLKDILEQSLNNTCNQQEIYKAKQPKIDRKQFDKKVFLLTQNQRKQIEILHEIVEFQDFEKIINKK